MNRVSAVQTKVEVEVTLIIGSPDYQSVLQAKHIEHYNHKYHEKFCNNIK